MSTVRFSPPVQASWVQDDMPKLSVPTRQTNAAGEQGTWLVTTATYEFLSTSHVTATYELIQESTPAGCVVGVKALETPTAVPDPKTPGQSMTIQNVMTTECSSATTMRLKGEMVTLTRLPGETEWRTWNPTMVTVVTTSTTAVTTTSTASEVEEGQAATLSRVIVPSTRIETETEIAATMATASPAPTSIPGKHHLSPSEIGIIVTSPVLGLLLFIGLAFWIRRCLQKRKEARHSGISRFWRGMFTPFRETNRDIPLSNIPRAAPETATSRSAPQQSSFADTYANTKSPSRSEFSTAPNPHQTRKSPFTSFTAAVAAKAHTTPSDKFPLFFNSRAAREAAREQAQADGRAADINDEVNTAEVELGRGNSKGPSEFIEVCLDENVALEEQEKEERRKTDVSMMTWNDVKRAMSPFPSGPPSPPPPFSEVAVR